MYRPNAKSQLCKQQLFLGQWLGKHIPAATNMHVITELLLEIGCFYVVCAEMLQARDKANCSGKK
jgi:hypothetical protein